MITKEKISVYIHMLDRRFTRLYAGHVKMNDLRHVFHPGGRVNRFMRND